MHSATTNQARVSSCSGRGGGSAAALLPSFVVTSSDVAPAAAKAVARAKQGTTMTLNPDAQEFRLTPAFAGALFAMPSTAPTLPPPPPQQQQRWGSPSAMDFSAGQTAGRHDGVSHGSGSPPPPPISPAAVAGDVMDSKQLIEKTEACMHEWFDRRCREGQLHMVSVFHLHPRTTEKQLSRIFFPTGAVAAEVLEPRTLPESLAKAYLAMRQRAGVVFFPRKDFAVVGVEKVHDFVPHGQHQPLVVRYCGPDAAASRLSSGSPAPARSHSGESATRTTRTAKTASPPPSVRPTPPALPLSLPHHRDVVSPATAVPGVTAEPTGAATSATAATPTTLERNASAAAVYDAADQHFIKTYGGEREHLVGVHNLACSTTSKSLYKMFYPMGAIGAEVLPHPVSVEGKLQRSGVAFFDSVGMAMEAASKIDAFVPHGQRRPVVARYLTRSASPAPVSPPATQDAAVAATASTPRGRTSSPFSATGAAALLDAIEMQLRAKVLYSDQLAADMAELVLCTESGEPEADKLAALLRNVLFSMDNHSTVFSSLSGAFCKLHTLLGIRMRTAPATVADASLSVRKGTVFLQRIGHMLMRLVAEKEAAHQTRIVAAIQCAYLYQYTYLPQTPVRFAAMLFSSCERELREALGFLHHGPEVPSSLAEERQHRPWITLMDALQEMVSVWQSLDPTSYAQDEAREEYERFVRDFRGVHVTHRSSPATSSASAAATAVREQQSGACTPRNDALEMTAAAAASAAAAANSATASAKRSLLVTPSARPTPRRVVAKSYSTVSDLKATQGTPVGGSCGAVPPQVMLASPGSEYTQGASELSANSASVGTAIGSALRSVGRNAPHPTTRLSWGSRSPASTAFPQPVAPPAPMVSAAAMLPAAPTLSASSSATATSAAAGAEQRSDEVMTACTVYITKLPSCLSAGQVRRLLLHFGEFRKVRLCYDDKETTRVGSAEALAAHNLKFDQLCFGFVEFSESSSAKAMVEFFRNEVHTPKAFDFLRGGVGELQFGVAELDQLRNTRTSQARNPIHDQQPLDAARAQPCLFGVLHPHRPVDTYAETITAEEVAQVARQLQEEAGAALPCTYATPFTHSAPYSTTPSLEVSHGGPTGGAAVAPLPGITTTAAATGCKGDDGDDDEDDGRGSGAFSMAGLCPLDAVHFPRSFPYHQVFATAAPGSDAHPPSDDIDLYSYLAPVIVEDEDDEDGDGLAPHQVQDILGLLG
ncbi:hypothetical protein NESM_000739500 [Novymonas esmeraldas]|uniref:RRM domain-containing protein n=1 Tax=Novymonas esmeraldas TaxID=1808958 RepID=A0AAW0EVT5_9TRYP